MQVIKSPPRITATCESLIDVILVCNPKLTKSSGVIKTLISDHYPVSISLKLKVEKTRPQIITALKKLPQLYPGVVCNGNSPAHLQSVDIPVPVSERQRPTKFLY